MHILVFGSTGQVGQAFARLRWPNDTRLTALDRQAADLSRPDTLGAIVKSHAPDAVIIAAAYTAVDAAESNEALATTINAAAPGAIARAAAELSVPVLLFSTDYVFDGEKAQAYVETDPVAPINAYGRSKLAGEIAVRAENPRHLILRTSWVYSATGTNFLRTMLRLAASKDEVRVVSDQRGCPTAASDLANAVGRILPAAMDSDGPWGTYHLAGGAETTWHGFAGAIFKELRARGMPIPVNTPIKTIDYPTPAGRPENSSLSSEKFARTFGVRLSGYSASLTKIVDEALASQP